MTYLPYDGDEIELTDEDLDTLKETGIIHPSLVRDRQCRVCGDPITTHPLDAFPDLCNDCCPELPNELLDDTVDGMTDYEIPF